MPARPRRAASTRSPRPAISRPSAPRSRRSELPARIATTASAPRRIDRSRPVRLRIWDGPTRLFHWSLAILIAAAWWTAEEHLLGWHYRIGFAILCLLVFRVVWGFIGSSTARFAGFVRGPRAILAYLRGTA